MKKTLVFSALLASGLVHADTDSARLDEIYRLLKAQQARIEQLEKELAATRNTSQTALKKAEEADEKTEILAEQSEQGVSDGRHGHGANAANTHVGGYGELHVNLLDNQKPGGEDKNETDFHRFVLYLGHDFTDKIRFNSELEVEHSLAGDGAPGEVSLEQAYLEFDHANGNASRAGVLLMPVGFINETHEPNTFYGVERNTIANKIIPTTWAEGGYQYHWQINETLSADFLLTSGLQVSAGKNYTIRKGRTKVAEASFNDPAYTARVSWKPLPGMELNSTFQYQSDVTQSTDSSAGAATLFTLAGQYLPETGPGVRAVYATWNLDGEGPASVGADEQTGYYIEPSWRLNRKLGFFARYGFWDNQAGDAIDSEYSQFDLGVNYWPTERVVIKADYQNQSTPDGKNEYDGINLGVGYQF